ncbi:MAG: hypothetical protein GF308_08135 [Candidatus Heimdallarchaeota archaeon]|nr:hypothetical protein [Candidatus Heimdallarchaeota archaeon]
MSETELTGLIESFDHEYQEKTSVTVDNLKELVGLFEKYHYEASEEHRAIVKSRFVMVKDGIPIARLEKY